MRWSYERCAPRSQIMDSLQHCHVGWNWLWALWRVWLPRKVCAFFRLCPLADFLNLFERGAGTLPRLPTQRYFFAAARSSRLEQTRRCDGVGGRPRMTEGLFMYLFGSRIAIYSRCILLKWSARMSGHPPQRRQTNVGSMMLTTQENECLFNCLGRKCIVSFSTKFCHSKLSKMLMQLTCTVSGRETGS